MSLQDGLLSFQIKETIFLSSDKAGIGELKELELVPDVEIIENPTEVSITGCLQLHGKYEPVGSASEESDGGADTLVAAMKFTPYQFERKERGLYDSDQELSHRIPLNITIPSNRVSDINDIYAIVDSFDYQLAASNQLVIEAELKIAGIALVGQETQAEPEWEFVHVAHEQEEQSAESQSLDDIERKLAQLEQELSRKEHAQREKSQDLPQPYVKPYVAGFEPPTYQPSTHFPPTYQSPAHVAETLQDQSYHPASYHRFGDVSSEQEQNTKAPLPDEVDQTDAVLESGQVTEVLAQKEDLVQERPVESDEPATAMSPSDSAKPAIAEEPVAEEAVQEVVETEEQGKEMRVAIGSKQIPERSGSLNLTSIFAQASRAQERPASDVHDSTSGSSHSPRLQETDSNTLEAMHNLTSFVRNKEERYSTMKLCIIQRDETLESIASRYSLPVSKILEVNKMSSDRVVEGQILYIPV